MGQIHRLSARTIATKKRRGLYCDGGGLYLQIAEGGTKTWIFRFRSPLTKKPRHMGIPERFCTCRTYQLARVNESVSANQMA